MPPVLSGIAANDMPLRSGCFKTIDFQYLGNDAPLDACVYLPDQFGIIDNVVPAAFKGVVFDFDRLTAHLAHHPELPTSISSIALDKLVAKIEFENVGQVEYWGMKFNACKTTGRWKVSQMLE
jgi:hypothetical protein